MYSDDILKDSQTLGRYLFMAAVDNPKLTYHYTDNLYKFNSFWRITPITTFKWICGPLWIIYYIASLDKALFGQTLTLVYDHLKLPCKIKLAVGETTSYINSKSISNSSYLTHWVALSPGAPYLIILLCLTPDDFNLSNARQFYSSRGERWCLMG
jgi:hypothetical protein